MRELTGNRPGVPRPGRESEYDKTVIRIIVQIMNTDEQPSFLRKLTVSSAPDVQARLYAFVKTMICSWAGRKSDLSGEDGAVIEDCRKICDVMGWPASW